MCAALDTCHVAGTCAPATGTCSNPPAASGIACDDHSVCTHGDVCDGSGTCSGTAVVCAALDQCHVAGTCDPTNGCSNPAATDGTACVDSASCTFNPVCKSGTCQGSATGTETIDQQQTAFDVGWDYDLSPFWQEFVPATTGRFTRLTIYKNGLSGTQTVTLKVFTGSGIGGTSIYSGSFSLPNVATPTDLAIGSGGPFLTAGTHYTFQIIDPSNTLSSLGKSGNPYTAGTSAFASYMNFDFWFEEHVTPSCE